MGGCMVNRRISRHERDITDKYLIYIYDFQSLNFMNSTSCVGNLRLKKYI